MPATIIQRISRGGKFVLWLWLLILLICGEWLFLFWRMSFNSGSLRGNVNIYTATDMANTDPEQLNDGIMHQSEKTINYTGRLKRLERLILELNSKVESIERNASVAASREIIMDKTHIPAPTHKNDTDITVRNNHAHTMGGSDSNTLANSSSTLGLDTVLLIMASNRPAYLERCLDAVVKYHPLTSVPIVLSEDGTDRSVAKVVHDARERLAARGAKVPFLHAHHPAYIESFFRLKDYRLSFKGYYRLSKHFKWALNNAFHGTFTDGNTVLGAAKRVIILEEDLIIASDFFSLFAALRPFVDNDPTVLTASAWNDNGFEGMVKDPAALFRSDFFPGLGWMLSDHIWAELGPKWPVAFWDDWLREDEQRKCRQSLHPEVCRTLHIGNNGASNAQFGQLLKTIHLNDNFVDFGSQDLRYLEPSKWREVYLGAVNKARMTTLDDFMAAGQDAVKKLGPEVRIMYRSIDENKKRLTDSFFYVANTLGAMNDVKAGVPRSAFEGVVTIWKYGVKIHLVPETFQ